MTPRSLRLVPLLAAALLTTVPAAAPVTAQEPGPAVAYAGVAFTLAPELGASIAIVPVTAQPPDAPVPNPQPGHLSFAFSRVTREQARIPATWGAPGTLSVYQTADLAGYDWPEQQLAALQAILEARPDPSTLASGAPDADPLPYIGGGDAAQLVRARVHYIDTPQLSGIAYVAAFGQDVYRMGASDFWYTFQGLSVDGSRYVQVSWVLTAPGFPRRSSFNEGDTRGNAYARYLRSVVEKLDAGDATAFSPTIGALDGLVESITFQAIPVREPALPSLPDPSAAPAG
jgi:hypothetical protein